MQLSIVIPAYDEADRLPPTLDRVCSYFSSERRWTAGRDFEVVVVDDGSRDRTAEVAEAFTNRGVRTLRQGQNRGKGAALKAGVLATRGERVLLCDADLSTPIEDLERLEPGLSDAQLVFGSRATAGSNVTQHQPLHRELMGKVFNLIIRALGITALKDTQCGFKLLVGDVARQLFSQLTVERFAFDVELVWLARRSGFEVREVGVNWANSPATRVDPLVDSFRMLRDVLRFRFRRR